jgi:hypothetical protein
MSLPTEVDGSLFDGQLSLAIALVQLMRATHLLWFQFCGGRDLVCFEILLLEALLWLTMKVILMREGKTSHRTKKRCLIFA